ncbi:potassium channel family protein [Evansella sp. AB-rgal1]|uniref:potassium channel family protein n=1 Tax=Evansella sp. AB-rgal1 TaxID=3242696 RepID=UPI00359DCC60
MKYLLLLIVVIVAVAGVISSIYLLLKNQQSTGRKLSLRHFIVLFLVYATITAGFGVVYLSLELTGLSVLVEDGQYHYDSFFHLVEDVMYFSAVTLLTVGYGDITPQGIGRWIAIVQALIGYLLPAAFVVTSVFIYERERQRL